MKGIVIAGGTGFLGRCLIEYFRRQDIKLIILSRARHRDHDNVQYEFWDGKNQGSWMKCLEEAPAVINLTGKSVDCRYTEKNMKLIYSSRLEPTVALGTAIRQCNHPPKLWINAASATIYRHSIDKEMGENTGEIGIGFSVDVCKKWEATFNSFETPQTRKVILRTGIVLGRNGGPFIALANLVRVGFGGKQGSGTQYLNWLHEKDFCGIVSHILNNENMQGVYNVTAPNPAPNQQVMKTFRKALGIAIGLPLTRWMLEIGAWIIRTETELVLKSRRVVPSRLHETGYTFQFKTIEQALSDLCR